MLMILQFLILEAIWYRDEKTSTSYSQPLQCEEFATRILQAPRGNLLVICYSFAVTQTYAIYNHRLLKKCAVTIIFILLLEAFILQEINLYYVKYHKG